MVEREKVANKFWQILIFLICLAYFVPYLLKPQILTHKDNDLGRNYLPIAMFVQKSVLGSSQIPLWRPEQMMGETFVGSPLSSIFYPANILFISKNIDFALIIYLFLHTSFSGFATFGLARSFKLSPLAAFSAALFYAFSIKTLLHLSAGHITMVAAFSYFPLLFLSTRMIFETSSPKWVIVGAVSLTFMYFLYPTIFYYSIIFISFYWLIKLFKKSKLFFLMLITSFLLSSIVLLPQLEFAPLSTRSSLKLTDIAEPLWNFKKFTTSIFFPYVNIDDFDHESLLYFGMVPSVLAIIGFFYTSRIKKIILIIFGFFSLFFVLGLSTPFFEFCYRFMPLLKYSRITTRMWFLVIMIISLLAAIAIERIKNKKIVYLLILFFIAESFFISYRKIRKLSNLDFENEKLYEAISKDKDFFRVYCTTYCFNTQLVSKYNIQTLHGEDPIQDRNFVNFLEKAGNYSYKDFAVIFPPYQVWQISNPPIPNSELLGLANVKYVTSTYAIQSQDYEYLNKFKEIYLYKNLKYRPRTYFQDSSEANITKYDPNNIEINFASSTAQRNLIISDNYYPGWVANIDHQKYPVEKYESVFRKITVPPNAKKLELKYQPESYAIGKTLTFGTVVAILLYYIRSKKIKR